ncbi:peptidylprolyl isomerase [Sinirhodobacter sp. WL0062]|uniref:Parvulin-like PPIase n=2 Tax=Rhodobacter flavimaris TaxID=2907145 RepID=A0ABS8YWN3_9RHOB|nr:peptidylprolyl isomerase [Sinirhodobacter sp. WL0062]
MKRILPILAMVCGSVLMQEPGRGAALAQSASPFAPVIMVNDLGITAFEIEQRVKFLELLRQTGDLQAEAEKALIEDRLRESAAKRAGITLSAEALSSGMSEFAGRANLTTEQFVQELSQVGIEEQTFRDFVSAGLLWRDAIRAKYANRIRITAADIDHAMLLESERGQTARVLISEIIIPTPPGQEAEAMAAARRASAASGDAAFSALAREFSATESAPRGGHLDWMEVSNMPPALRPVIMGLKPGQASAPMQIPNAVAVFMLRSIDEGGKAPATAQTLEYTRFIVGPATAAQTASDAGSIAARVDRCDDFYGIAKDLPAERLIRETLPQGAIPQDIAIALASMDIGETRALQRGANTELVTLCKREKTLAEGETAPTRDEIGQRLTNQRLNAYSDSDIADLLANAVIVRP